MPSLSSISESSPPNVQEDDRITNRNLVYEDWQSWPFIAVLVDGLPPRTTTSIVHKNLMQYGNIQRIILNDGRKGGEIYSAVVTFKPPPKEMFWNQFVYEFRGPEGYRRRVRLRPARNQHTVSTIKSPVRNIRFPEEISLLGSSLGFGVLGKAKEMFVMKTISAQSEAIPRPSPGKTGACVPRSESVEVSLKLNLHRREIMIYFPILLQSSSVGGSRTRSYRFPVSFDDNFDIWKLTKKNGTALSYIIRVRNPPWYSRRLENALGASHDPEAKQWYEDDLWTRQTDIVQHKDHFDAINATPVSLRKNMNRINIARWTTFKLDPDVSSESSSRLQIFDDALKDWNIHINTDTEDFMVHLPTGHDDAPYWRDIEDKGDPNDPLDDGCTLSFDLRYQLEVCISNGRLSEYDVGKSFLYKLKSLNEAKAKQMLVHVDSYAEELRDSMSVFEDIRFQKPVRARQLPKNCAMIHHATVTATSIKVHTTSVEVSNRVIRKHALFADRFLRVKFEDDEYRGKTRIFAGSNSKMKLIIDRVRRALSSGINIAGRHYDFLAYGNSQLREHGVYFFASCQHLTATMIRAEMGAFDNEKIVAKRAARMGQCFSTTHPIHYRLPVITQDTLISDITRNGCTFTDGVGKISPLAATLVQGSLGISGPVPSCFQFRLGGCKGVLVIDPSLSGITVKMRPSQFKFESKSQELEIIRCSQFWQPFLNRQIIIVLSHLGVRDDVFLEMQKDTIEALSKAMKNDDAALQALRTHVDPNMMTLSMCDLITNGFRRVKEPFVMALLELWRAYSLKYLKEKAKIPVKNGAFVLGVVDETDSLQGHFDDLQAADDATRAEKENALPQIFLQINDPVSGTRKVIEGVCIIARNPSLHPGDIRVVKAVDMVALRHLCDVVVMPQNGSRDLPSMCSGGDLDGDDYVVIWDCALIPSIWNAKPHHYHPPSPKKAEGEITTQDIIDFFIDYMENDILGRIAHAHLANADNFIHGVSHNDCLELVQLHSTSVDYPKTGVPARLPRRLEPTRWPHFMEKKISKDRQYTSGKILGQLFDDVTKSVKRFGFRARYHLKFDARILDLERPEMSYFAQVEGLKYDYDMAMQRIMAQHKIKTEFEVWSTFVMSHSKQSNDYKFHEEIGRISKTLKDDYRAELFRLAGGSDFDRLLPYALAAYQLTADQVTAALSEGDERTIDEGDDAMDEDDSQPRGSRFPFCSFPWLLSDVLGKIASMSGLEAPEVVKGATREPSNRVTEVTRDGHLIANSCNPKSHAHNASPEFKRGVRFDSISSSSPLFIDIDPFGGSTQSVKPSSAESTGCVKKTATEASIATSPVLRTKPETLAGAATDKVATDSKLRADALEHQSILSHGRGTSPGSGDIYGTKSFCHKSEDARPIFNDSDSFVHDSSPTETDNPENELRRAMNGMGFREDKPHVVRPTGVMKDPALMTEEEKFAYFGNDDDM